MQRFDNIPEVAVTWHEAGHKVAFATVVETWGSAPRKTGSQMIVNALGEMAGSVSGGCVEGAVVIEALEAIDDGAVRVLEFGISDEDAFAVGLACGGQIKVRIDPVGPAFPVSQLYDLVAARAARLPVAVLHLLGGECRVLATNEAREKYEARFTMDKSGFDPDGAFVAIHNPPLRMIIVGAVHIAQALVPMARLAGYDPAVVDPRDSFAAKSRFPGEQLVLEWPDDAVMSIGLDARTALILLTHDPKLDDPALECGLRSDAFYIGALGSKRTHAKRCDRMHAAGHSAAQIARIHGPVGVDIGAAGPGEIAISIMAEVTKVLRGK